MATVVRRKHVKADLLHFGALDLPAVVVNQIKTCLSQIRRLHMRHPHGDQLDSILDKYENLLKGEKYG